MPRSKERRTKGEAVEEEFPFLGQIISSEVLGRVLAETRWSGFLVRVMREEYLFSGTGEAGDMETWVVYTCPSLPQGSHAERLPEGKPVWEVFPYDNEKPNGPRHRKFIALVQVHMQTQDGELKGLPSQIILRKMPKGVADLKSFKRTLEGVRRVADWTHERIYNQGVSTTQVERLKNFLA
jgi:hypothetical protein